MKTPLYIISACAVSPQYSFDPAKFLVPVVSSNDSKLYALNPDYTQFISPVAIRRMSRLLKMGIASGIQCLHHAGITQPDAIITGTGRGSVTDMENFLKDMIHLEEQALNPTFFIQSTYNSVNGWLALQTKATCYNQTYVHRAFSFELALFDAQLLLQEAGNTTQYLLVGCFDELTEEYFFIRNKIDYWKKEQLNSFSLLQHSSTTGTIAGEGASFFTVTNKKDNAICELLSVEMLQKPTQDEVQNAINNLLKQSGIEKKHLDVAVCGINGDIRYQPLYNTVIDTLSDNTTVVAFKHLCGEYDTATGFALWLATQLFSTQTIPEEIMYKKGKSNSVKYVLICNHYFFSNVSLIILKANV